VTSSRASSAAAVVAGRNTGGVNSSDPHGSDQPELQASTLYFVALHQES
jgi:hypothetical protein